MALLAGLGLTLGCTTTYDAAASRARIAPLVQSQGQGILLQRPIAFAVTARNAEKAFFQPAVLAQTETEVFVYPQDLSTIPYEPILRLTYSEIASVAVAKFGRARQIQLATKTSLVAFDVSTDGTWVDQEAAEQFVAFVKGKGVPEINAARHIGSQPAVPPGPIIIPIIM